MTMKTIGGGLVGIALAALSTVSAKAQEPRETSVRCYPTQMVVKVDEGLRKTSSSQGRIVGQLNVNIEAGSKGCVIITYSAEAEVLGDGPNNDMFLKVLIDEEQFKTFPRVVLFAQPGPMRPSSFTWVVPSLEPGKHLVQVVMYPEGDAPVQVDTSTLTAQF
jgi:hypothetical protein